ncbi:MAG: aminotransferase class V-fold PLP-dependent enzyme [Burkholderiales bacterium]
MTDSNNPHPAPAFGHALRSLWSLDPEVTFLNHGSFGATPIAVLAEQNEWRARMERQPVHFMTRELPGALRRAADSLAAFLGTRGEQIGFVDNATSAVNAVLRWIDWHAGDEVVVCRQVYPGVRGAANAVAERFGVRVKEARFAIPIQGEDAVLAAFDEAMNSSTRLVIVDHVSSPLAAVLPVARIVALCRQRGVPVLVDGAHAPGMLDLDLDELGADWYAGNCHKWLYAPKGSAFLWSARHRLVQSHPAVISMNWAKGFAAEFDWAGTRDPSPWLCVPAAIRFFESLGVAAARQYMIDSARTATTFLEKEVGAGHLAPAAMFASMAALTLPRLGAGSAARATHLHDRLIDRHGIEIPILLVDEMLCLRLSAQVYNDPGDFARLVAALCAEGMK